MKFLNTTLAATVLAAAVVAAPPQLPATPAPVQDIVFAQPFTLDRGEVSNWRAERPEITSGYILVLKVDPDLVYPRQTAEPVLYVGNPQGVSRDDQRVCTVAVQFDVAVDDSAQRCAHCDVRGNPSWENPHHPVVERPHRRPRKTDECHPEGLDLAGHPTEDGDDENHCEHHRSHHR